TGFSRDWSSDVCSSDLTTAPVLVAPAMEHHMWHHPATQADLSTLREWGVTIIEPEAGRLVSGASGDGRLATRERLVSGLRAVLEIGRASCREGEQISDV